MLYPMPPLGDVFESFGWNVANVDATHYDGVFEALNGFRFGPRNGRPTAIICNSKKGFGAFSDFLNKQTNSAEQKNKTQVRRNLR